MPEPSPSTDHERVFDPSGIPGGGGPKRPRHFMGAGMKGMWRCILPPIMDQPPKLELTPVNPKSAAAKGKPELSLIPTVALVEEAKALTSGADKYGAYNYLATQVQASAYVDAAMRHIRAWMDGDDLDESGANHLGHARASLAILLDAAAASTLIDDRPHVLRSLYLASKS